MELTYLICLVGLQFSLRASVAAFRAGYTIIRIRFAFSSEWKPSQTDHYDDRKRPQTAVHDDVNSRNRHNYDRIRAVNNPFGMGRVTVVRRRVVYGEKRTSFTLKPVP